MPDWWESFFDADYLRLWEAAEAPDKTTREASGLWAVLSLTEGSRVLDAPGGDGRLSRGLAERGAQVLGVDRSGELSVRSGCSSDPFVTPPGQAPARLGLLTVRD